MSENDTDASAKSMGRGMLLVAWGLIFAGLIAFFSNVEDQQNNPNQQVAGTISSDGTREVTLTANRYHHYIATGEINDEPVVFLVDTGATDVSIPESLANHIGLRKGIKAYAKTANGTIGVWATNIDKLTLGNLVFYDVRASINPGMDGDEVLLGMSALRHVELIQKDSKLTLRQSAE